MQHSLNWMRQRTGSQCSWSRLGVTWALVLSSKTRHSALVVTAANRPVKNCSNQHVTWLQQERDESSLLCRRAGESDIDYKTGSSHLFGANRKRICDFLLVRNSNLGPILHRFWVMTAFMCSWPHPYLTLFLGVFPLHQVATLGVNVCMGLKLFGREIIFEEFKSIWTRHLNVTDEQIDRQTTCYLITALCASIAR